MDKYFKLIEEEGKKLASSKKVEGAYSGSCISTDNNKVCGSGLFMEIDIEKKIKEESQKNMLCGIVIGFIACFIVVKIIPAIKSFISRKISPIVKKILKKKTFAGEKTNSENQLSALNEDISKCEAEQISESNEHDEKVIQDKIHSFINTVILVEQMKYYENQNTDKKIAAGMK